MVFLRSQIFFSKGGKGFKANVKHAYGVILKTHKNAKAQNLKLTPFDNSVTSSSADAQQGNNSI